jgi:hypothetical protein
MSTDDSDDSPREPKSAPRVVAPRNAVNVAFPFSTIHVERSSKDIAELAVVVAELAAMVEGPQADDLRDRATALASRLR